MASLPTGSSRVLLLVVVVLGLCAAGAALTFTGRPPAAEWELSIERDDDALADDASAALDDERRDPVAVTAGLASAGARSELTGDGALLGPRESACDVTVFDPAGQPIADAIVEALHAAPASNADPLVDERRTDADGRAVLRLPRDLPFHVRARAPDFVPANVPSPRFGAVVTIRLEAAAKLEGRILDPDGKPVAARIELHGPAGPWRPARAAAAAVDGSYTFTELIPGNYDVVLIPAGGTPFARTVAAGVFLPAGASRQDFLFARGASVFGVVRATDGAPIRGARVRANVELRSAQRGRQRQSLETRTDAEGRYRIAGLAVGRVVVDADTRDHQGASRAFELRETIGERELDLVLAPSITLAGIVRDTEGHPVAEAEVHFGRLRNGAVQFHGRATTDADGRFEIRDQPLLDAAMLVARKDGFAPGGAGVPNLVAGERREGIEVRMQGGIVVRGRVVAPGSLPVESIAVALIPQLGADRFTQRIQPGPDGRFAFSPMPALEYRLELQHPELLPLSQKLTVDGKQREVDVGDLRPTSAHVVRGVVWRRHHATGVAHARVVLEGVEKGQSAGQSATTDAFGAFAIAGVPAGRYRVRVNGADVRLTREAMPIVSVPGADVAVHVDVQPPVPTGVVTGRLRDQATGQAIEGVVVQGVDPRRVTVQDGRFTVVGMPAGLVDVVVGAKGYQSIQQRKVAVDAGGIRDLHDLWLQPGGNLVVRVVDERGRAIAANRVKLVLTDVSGRTLAHHLQPVEIDQRNGIAKFEGLAMATFVLQVTGPGNLLPVSQQIEIVDARPVQWKVTLKPKPRPTRRR